jgi:hypothetical protein
MLLEASITLLVRFKVQASHMRIIVYNHHNFIVQATDYSATVLVAKKELTSISIES